MKPTNRYNAVIVVNNPAEADRICDCCSDYGIETQVFDDPEKALKVCRTNPPNLVVVQHELQSMSGLELINALLRISWTISVVMIVDADEETVHDRTEGLGILGHMEHAADLERLKGHLDTFVNIMASTAQQS